MLEDERSGIVAQLSERGLADDDLGFTAFVAVVGQPKNRANLLLQLQHRSSGTQQDSVVAVDNLCPRCARGKRGGKPVLCLVPVRGVSPQ